MAVVMDLAVTAAVGVEIMKIYDENKVESLRVHILEECKRQGFTVWEFELLILYLGNDFERRQRQIKDEVLAFPCDSTETIPSNKTTFTRTIKSLPVKFHGSPSGIVIDY